MYDWQNRVVEERTALSERLGRLRDFVNGSDAFMDLPIPQRTMLIRQKGAMTLYLDVLDERIASWGKSVP